MIDALFNQPNYIAAKKLLDATALRMEATAANIANLETPNYRRVDVAASFETQLKEAIGTGDAREIAALQPALEVDRNAVARRRDGNTVDLETEMLQLHRTSLEHAVETQFITGNLLKLRMAITGRPV
jgi:flagellar basal-body rod protein FlgB